MPCQLIVEEHDTLIYPEGTACADVLIAGERGGSFASRVFLGLGLGGVYTLFQNENLFALWPSTPKRDFDIGSQHLLKGASIRADVTPEYLGVGYIIGIRVAAIMLAGGVFSWLVLMPAIYFFGSHLSTPLYPGTVLITQMSPSDPSGAPTVRPMGAGAVAAAGLITLLRTLPTIVGALTQGFKKPAPNSPHGCPLLAHREHDLPPSSSSAALPSSSSSCSSSSSSSPSPERKSASSPTFAAALPFVVVVFGFLFVTVSASHRRHRRQLRPHLVALGMTIATLMATAAIFLVKGWTAPNTFGALAITIGGVVCIAASNAGDTSQDLKTGYLIGATPWKQQIAIMIGVIISIFSIGATLNAMNKGLETFQRLPKPIVFSIDHLPDGVQNNGHFPTDTITITSHNAGTQAKEQLPHANQYILLNSIGSTTLEDGKYLYNPTTGEIEIQWIQGIGSEKAAAPQGRLMATVINGILSRKLPFWALVMLGVAIVIKVVELLGVRSLTFAVGAYLSIATTLAIFVGGVVRWLVDAAIHRHAEQQAQRDHDASLALWHSDRETWLLQNPDFDPTNPAHADLSGRPLFSAITARDVTLESEVSPGSLYASGLIAAGGIVGLMGVCIRLLEGLSEQRGGHWQFWRFTDHNPLYHDWVSVIMFALLASQPLPLIFKPANLSTPRKVSNKLRLAAIIPKNGVPQ